MTKKTVKANKKPGTPVKKGAAQSAQSNDEPLAGTARIVKAGGSVVGGNVTVKNGSFVGRDKIDVRSSSSEVQVLFQPIYRAIAERPNTRPNERADLEAEVKEVETEVVKGETADESFLLRRLRNIERMAPDILQVVMATIVSPAAGLGLAASKVAKKMAKDAGAGAG